MGQYYKLINVSKKEQCSRNRGMMKLTEFSYLANPYVMDTLKLMSDEWKNDEIICVGDYADGSEPYLGDDYMLDLKKRKKVDNFYNIADSYKEVVPKNNDDIRYVYNHSKKEYIDLFEQPVEWFCLDKLENKIYSAKFNSFSLLVACGNGLGGGDYYGINVDKIGSWAGDVFETSPVLLDKYKTYQKNTLAFDEYDDRFLVFHDYEKFGNEIINADKAKLNNFMINVERGNMVDDIKKLKLSKEGLTNKEYTELNKYLNNEIKKKGVERS